MAIEDNHGFRIPHQRNVNLGIWIPWAESQIPKRRIWDSANKNFRDSATQFILNGAREKGRKRENLRIISQLTITVTMQRNKAQHCTCR